MLIKLLRPFKKFAGKCIRLAYKLTYRLFKVDDKLAIFISFHGRGYSDNPKAIYEQMRHCLLYTSDAADDCLHV